MTPERYKWMREIFDSAVELPSGSREEFVRARCGDDEEMYLGVMRMLRAHEHTAVLDEPPAANGAAPARALSERVFTEGQIVAGRYRIVRYLSCGGMGEVYEAEDLHLPEMKEHIALKTLLPAIAADQSMVARFRQEIALSRKVQHPNVCAAFDISRHEAEGSAPVLFLTMPFLAGETLAARLHDGGRMKLEEALPSLEQMAEALDAAHRAGVIHRDFKPSNVMLVPAERGVRAVVTDFGLARRLATGTDTTSTVTAHVAGTLDYMAPELLTGSMASVSSDVYALGMTAYRMVTGTLPFANETPLAGAILRAKQAVPPARTIVPELDPKWDSAIQRALDAKPGNRYSSTGGLVQAMSGEPVSVTVRLPVVTRRRAIAVILAAALLVGGGVAWKLWKDARNRPSAEAEALYRTGVDDIHAGAYFAATKALGKAVEIAPRYALARARLADAWVELDTPDRAKDEMLVATREDLSGLSEMDRLQIEAINLTITREYSTALGKYLRMAQLAGGDKTELAVDLGRIFEKAGKPDDAINSYRRAAENPAHNPAAWLRLGVLYGRRSEATKSDEAFGHAEQLYQLTSSLEGLIEVAFQRGIAADRRNQIEEGAAYLHRALETARPSGDVHQEIRINLQLATNAYLAGDADSAKRYADEALSAAQSNGLEFQAIAGLLNLGNAGFRKPDFQSAERYYNSALALARSKGSQRFIALSLSYLAAMHDEEHLPEQVIREINEALPYFQSNRFAQETFSCNVLLGRAELARGNPQEALASGKRLLDLAQTSQNRTQLARAEEALGAAYYDLEALPDALEHYRKRLALSDGDEAIAYADLNVGKTLCRLGECEEARPLFAEAITRGKKFPPVLAQVAAVRADLALYEGHASEAARLARQTLSADAAESPVMKATLETTVGLALLASGRKREGLRICETSMEELSKLEAPASFFGARIAVFEARMASGDNAGALKLLGSIQADLDRHPEARWRVLEIASRADPRYSAQAHGALSQLKELWGSESYQTYLQRPDIRKLSRPLLEQHNGNYE